MIQSQKLKQLQRDATRKQLAEEVAKNLRNALLQVHMKAQEDGTLYGSVNQTIIANVVEQARGYRVEERWVQLESPIKKIGDYDISLKMPGEKECVFKLTVLPEGE